MMITNYADYPLSTRRPSDIRGETGHLRKRSRWQRFIALYYANSNMDQVAGRRVNAPRWLVRAR